VTYFKVQPDVYVKRLEKLGNTSDRPANNSRMSGFDVLFKLRYTIDKGKKTTVIKWLVC
jgi:hypothetical protein